MSVQDMQDAEYDLTKAIRDATGPDTIISATMDLHGNVSDKFLELLDLITCYRKAPHEDAMETKERAAVNLIKCLQNGKKRPYKAWLPIPVLLPGEKTSTRLEPAKSLYEKVWEIEAKNGVLDASLFIGYAWADEPRCRAYVIVVGDSKQTVLEEATKLGKAYWRERDNFKFVGDALHLDDCLKAADEHIKSSDPHKPFVISDSGDNPTAGGAGDVTWTLNKLLTHPLMKNRTAIYASEFDADAVKAAVEAGVGGHVEVDVAARIDNKHSGPAHLSGVVHHIFIPKNVKNTGDYSSDSIADGGVEVVINVNGLFVIVTEKRKPYHHKSDFYNLNLRPEEMDMLFVKIGYLEPELFDLADGGKYWKLGLTPGGVDQDLIRLNHQHLLPKTFPFYVPSDVEAAEIEKNLNAQLL
jgi:microcystin degradation protein MlrC